MSLSQNRMSYLRHASLRSRLSPKRSLVSARSGTENTQWIPPPPPEEGEKRCLFILDPLPSDVESNNRMLELLPGRVETVDGFNRYHIEGCIAGGNNEDMDYTLYRVTLGETRRSLYAVPPEVEAQESFVSLRKRDLLRYDSRKAIVVYMPENAELHYRIWCGGEEVVACSAE
ncbi:Ecotin-like protein 4 [Trypanosoma vivax]|nr:Ecotin-like protein 4 [Trypanosoma vivax]